MTATLDQQQQQQRQQQLEVSSPPTDHISRVLCAPDNAHVLSASWDAGLMLHSLHTGAPALKMRLKGALLDCCFGSGGLATTCTGGIDRRVTVVDVAAAQHNSSSSSSTSGSPESEQRCTVLGQHDDTVRALSFSSDHNALFSGSWDKTVRQWDARAPSAHVVTYAQPDKVLGMDTAQHLLVVAMNNRHVYVYDVRNMKETYQRRESGLKFMTRTIRCMPNGGGYVLTSVEGRVAVEFFDPSEESQAHKYAFKCHRQTVDGVDYVYPVNAIEFHPIYGTFASGGADGVVNIWDGANKKRLRMLPKFPCGVSSLSFSPDGTKLAVAASYTFEEGEKDHPPDTIFVRDASDSDVKPKVRAA
ncbi:mitotic spindle checkpoint protein Bub3 [Sorochytrium milnesiophthora]